MPALLPQGAEGGRVTDHLPLFDKPQPERRPSIEERFKLWRQAHPEAIELMRRLALEKVRAGAKRIGMAALFERARWDMDVNAYEGGVKLNNDLRSRLARHLMEIEPALAGVFEVRELRTA
jgi:hypothetical protein